MGEGCVYCKGLALQKITPLFFLLVPICMSCLVSTDRFPKSLTLPGERGGPQQCLPWAAWASRRRVGLWPEHLGCGAPGAATPAPSQATSVQLALGRTASMNGICWGGTLEPRPKLQAHVKRPVQPGLGRTRAEKRCLRPCLRRNLHAVSGTGTRWDQARCPRGVILRHFSWFPPNWTVEQRSMGCFKWPYRHSAVGRALHHSGSVAHTVGPRGASLPS